MTRDARILGADVEENAIMIMAGILYESGLIRKINIWQKTLKIKENINMSMSTAIAYASAWIATAIAVIFAIRYTGSAWCLWALVIPGCINISKTK